MMFNLRSPGFAMHNFSIGDLIERMPEGIRNELWDCEARVVGGNLMRYRLAPVLVEKISQLPLKYRKQMYGIAKENAKGFMKDPKSVIFKVRADDIARIIAALPEEWRHPLASLSVTVPEKGKEMMMEKIEMRMPGIFSGNPPNPRWDF